MKDNRNEDLFELVKGAPTELSKEQVLEMITVLPTLPPPGNSWFSNINLNSIIMTTTVATLITSAVIYLSSPAPETLPGQEQASPAADTLEIRLSEDALPDSMSTSVPEQATPSVNNTGQEPTAANSPKATVSNSVEAANSLSEPLTETGPNSASSPTSEPTARKSSVDLIDTLNPSDPGMGSHLNTSIPRSTTGTRANNSSPSLSPADLANSTPDLTEEEAADPVVERLGNLKRQLSKRLYLGNIIPSKKPQLVTVLTYENDTIKVNFKALNPYENDAFIKILNNHGVTPGPNKRVVFNKDFIMVGDFTDTGFIGQARGKKMKIDFDNKTVFFDGINDHPERGLRGSITFGESDLIGSEGHPMLQTEAGEEEAKSLFEQAKVFKSPDPENGLIQGESYQFEQAVTMYRLGFDLEPVNLSNAQIKALKRALYQYLVEDAQITDKKALVALNMGETPFQVNDNSLFSGLLTDKYLALLQEYGIAPREKMKILMSPDFIMIGQFMNAQFVGTVQGRLNRNELKGTLLEKELANYGLFGEDATDDATMRIDNAEIPVKLTSEQIKGLKKELYDNLKSDGIIEAKTEHVMMRIEPQGFSVNEGKLFNSARQKQYYKLLKKHGVLPGPNKKIMMTMSFIAVGKFANGHFSGTLQGKYRSQAIRGSILEETLTAHTPFPKKSRITSPYGVLIHNEDPYGTRTQEISSNLPDGPRKQPQTDESDIITYGEYDEETSLDTRQIKALKKSLYKALVTDGQIASKTDHVLMKLEPTGFTVNKNARFSTAMQSRYTQLLGKHSVEPIPELKLIMTPDFILIGHFKDNNFLGTVQGNFREADLKGSILEEELKKYDVFRKGLQIKAGSESNIEINKEANEQDEKDERQETDEAGFPHDIEVDEPIFLSNRYSDEVKATAVKLKSKEVRNFKKALYQYLYVDQQIATKGDPVIMLIRPDLFRVNDNENLEGQVKGTYIRLLQQYNIAPAPNRKILMNHDFIMIGDFDNGDFHGTVQGHLEKKRVQGTILGDELAKSKVFGEQYDLPTETEEREIAPFEKLEVSGLAVVYLRQAKHGDARIDVSGYALEDVITESKNGTLKISTTRNNVSEESISVYVTSPEVYSIEVTGAAEVFSQGMYTTNILKLISKESGSIEMAVDVDRLHLQMDGGDIHLEGKALMEKVDFLPESHRGTLDQGGLNVLERWTHEGGRTWKEQDLPELRIELMSRLIDQGYISTYNNPASIQLLSNGMTVNGMEIAPNYLDDYRMLYKMYGLPTSSDSRIWIDPDFMVIAKKRDGYFELEVIGTELELNVEGSWKELEDAILER